MAKNWTRIDISCGMEIADDLGAELAEAFGAGVEFTPAGLRIYFDSTAFEEKRQRLQQVLDSSPGANAGHEAITWSSSELADEDWSETWKAHFKPLRVGRHFLVAPTWERVSPGPEDLLILIDPGRAFGTGHHETTRLCLEWLETWVGKQPAGRDHAPGSLLDVGTGSGILAMGAALLGFEHIVGIDNDPEAIEVAVPNLELNNLTEKIRVTCASVQDIRGAFDVVISNIQSMPLIRMAEPMVSRVRDGGRLALSGILTEQAEEVRDAYEERGASLIGTKTAGEWVLLEFAVSKKDTE
ncbi:MAG: 50S ribosomal protein L11 methyltransferase [Syntrophobacter sp.]